MIHNTRTARYWKTYSPPACGIDRVFPPPIWVRRSFMVSRLGQGTPPKLRPPREGGRFSIFIIRLLTSPSGRQTLAHGVSRGNMLPLHHEPPQEGGRHRTHVREQRLPYHLQHEGSPACAVAGRACKVVPVHRRRRPKCRRLGCFCGWCRRSCSHACRDRSQMSPSKSTFRS